MTPTEKQKAFVVMNPAAGGGLGRRLWPEISKNLRKRLGPYVFEETNSIGHARVIASDAAKAGYTLIIAYGGDGTVHEVVNGLHDSHVSPLPEIGIVSVGTGGDFVKTMQLPRNIKEQIRILGGSKTRVVDVGHVEYTNREGKSEGRIFVNIADAGLGGEVVRRIQRSRQFFGRKLAYISATLQSYLAWKPRRIYIQTDNPEADREWPEKILSVIIANGQYFGGGMPIAPKASPSDGYFDFMVIGKMHPLYVPFSIPLLYAKQLIRLPNVSMDRARSLTLVSEEPVDLDIDGEPIGSLPATFKILPKFLTIKVP